ncbi:MAG TPA: hypothetical protein VFV13_00940 [Acidimicrobiia bacterium]|nr:hypothetical protein [Acidimicrobiia bacterium]
MTTASPTKETRRALRWPPGPVTALVLLLSFLVIGALQGGLAMVMNPIDPLGMSPEFLEGAPVDDYFWPGMFLLGLGAASILTVAGLLFEWRWEWAHPIEAAIGYRWPWIGAMAIGLLLLIFEIIELFMVPFHPVMHPLLIGGSLAILLLAVAPSTRRHLQTEP